MLLVELVRSYDP